MNHCSAASLIRSSSFGREQKQAVFCPISKWLYSFSAGRAGCHPARSLERSLRDFALCPPCWQWEEEEEAVGQRGEDEEASGRGRTTVLPQMKGRGWSLRAYLLARKDVRKVTISVALIKFPEFKPSLHPAHLQGF